MPVPCGGAAAVAASAIDPAAPSRLPFAGTPEEDREPAAAKQAVWKLLDQRRLDPERPASGSDQRLTDLRVLSAERPVHRQRCGSPRAPLLPRRLSGPRAGLAPD